MGGQREVGGTCGGQRAERRASAINSRGRPTEPNPRPLASTRCAPAWRPAAAAAPPSRQRCHFRRSRSPRLPQLAGAAPQRRAGLVGQPWQRPGCSAVAQCRRPLPAGFRRATPPLASAARRRCALLPPLPQPTERPTAAMPLVLGDEVPNFTCQSTKGPITFHDFVGGKWTMLFSHPSDFTPARRRAAGGGGASEDWARAGLPPADPPATAAAARCAPASWARRPSSRTSLASAACSWWRCPATLSTPTSSVRWLKA